MNFVKIILRFVFFSLLLARLSTGFAQPLSFHHLTVENGLSGNAVIAIAQDADGFMWYGTQNNGLNKYDGVSFTTYTSIPGKPGSLAGNTVSSLLRSSDGRLWIGTSRGINIYSKQRDNFERVSSEGLTDSTIYCIYEDSDKNIWVGTKKGLHLLTDKKNFHFTLIVGPGGDHPAGRSVRCIFEDHDKHLWVGTQNGLIRIKDKKHPRQLLEYRHNLTPGSITGDYITSIIEDSLHQIWIGTHENGLNRYIRETDVFQRYEQSANGLVNNSIRKIVTDKVGNMWIGTQEGLSVYHFQENRFVSYVHHPQDNGTLSNNSIHSIYQDANKNIWVGTYFGGVNVAYAYNTPFEVYQHNASGNSISNNVISSIVEDGQQNLWIGTEGGGLNYFNRQNGLFTVYKNDPHRTGSLSSNLIKKIYKDSKQNLWIGTAYNKGLNMLDTKTRTFRLFTVPSKGESSYDEITSIAEDSQGQIWVGSQSGLHQVIRSGDAYQPILQTVSNPLLHDKDVRALYEDSHKTLWIGTTTGIYKWNPHQQLQRAFTQKPFDEANVNCIMEDHAGIVWIGTRNMGLIKWNPAGNAIRQISTGDGLPDVNVWGILEDVQHNLWISTENGLARYISSQGSFITYNTYDGLPGNKFNINAYCKDHNGRLFFGSYNGLISFKPENIETNQFINPVRLTGLRLFNTPVITGDHTNILEHTLGASNHISFGSSQNVFTIEFALLNYIKPHKNKYAYKLEGFDKQWNYTRLTSATYTNLPAGSYTFLLKASNNDDVWTHEPTRISITIDPPLWQSWWAYTLYILIAAAVLFLVTRFFYMRALFKKEYELQQLKLNFFTNISHEIRTHLTLIQAPVEKLSSINKDNSLATEMLRHIKTNATRLLELVTELMDFRKAETNNISLHVSEENLSLFLGDIVSSFRGSATQKNIGLHFIDNSRTSIYFDRSQMHKVFVNLLSNAFKFTPEGGTIEVAVQHTPEEVQVQVTDNGKGIAPADIKNIFTNYYQAEDNTTREAGYGIGLALSKVLTELHKGQLTVESHQATEKDQGYTRFTVILRKGHTHFSKAQLLPHKQIHNEWQPVIVPDDESDTPEINKKTTVLVVEDNTEVRNFITEALGDAYLILEADNGKAGLTLAFTELPDLVISDIMMPVMDGLSFCRQLKTDERTSHIPIILLTAKSSHEQQMEGWAHGADLYITKPFSLELLELQVRNLLAARLAMRQKYSRQVVLEPQDLVINDIDEQFLKKILRIVEDHINDPELGVPMLTEKVGMSKPVLYKKLKALTDMSVHDFIVSIRLKKAVQLLQQKQMTITEIAYAVGYNDRKYFSKEFKRLLGKSPKEFMGEDTDSDEQ